MPTARWRCSATPLPKPLARKSTESENRVKQKIRNAPVQAASRREFLQGTLAAGAAATFFRINVAAAATVGHPDAFEEIPPASSGISWTHASGRSAMAHLPETVGPGCAFFDYYNDGWMDS